jgi:hypothetical protein
MRWVGQSTHERYVYKFLVGKLEGNRPLGRPRCRQNMKVDLKERAHLTNLHEPYKVGKFLDQTNEFGFSRIICLRVRDNFSSE